MFHKHFTRLALAAAAAALTAGCASTPATTEQATAKPAEKGQCYYRTGSNHCWREGNGPSDVKTMSGDQMREAADEMRIMNIPRTN